MKTFNDLYEVKVDLENESISNCCKFMQKQGETKILCRCQHCGAKLEYRIHNGVWTRTVHDVHTLDAHHQSDHYECILVKTSMHTFLSSDAQDKSFLSLLTYLRTYYYHKVLPTDTARKIFTSTLNQIGSSTGNSSLPL